MSKANALADGQGDLPAVDPETVLALGDPTSLKALLDGGFDAGAYRFNGSDDALTTLVFRRAPRQVLADRRLIESLQLLIAAGVPLDRAGGHGRSASSHLFDIGRFDAVLVLLEAGVDARPLKLTALARAVAWGTVDEVRACLQTGPDLEAQDAMSRTPYLMAIQAGRTDIAQMLLDAGADADAVSDHGETAIFHAVRAGQLVAVRWLLARGTPVDQTDLLSNTTSLASAVEADDAAMVDLLLASGANPNHPQGVYCALASARSLPVAVSLVRAGADPRDFYMDEEYTRGTLSGPVETSVAFQGLTVADRKAHGAHRFGAANPEAMNFPFWQAMVRTSLQAWAGYGRVTLAPAPEVKHPVWRAPKGVPPPAPTGPRWCASRFGQSITPLPDGRVVLIGGEHEDSYDPDFCIYNDVIVHHPDGRVDIYGYPRDVFAPTDFHSATLVDHRIVIIGSLGYQVQRQEGVTPVHVLDTRSWRMERLSARGDLPGWISKHRAALGPERQILASGGEVMCLIEGKPRFVDNAETYVLDLDRASWHRQIVS